MSQHESFPYRLKDGTSIVREDGRKVPLEAIIAEARRQQGLAVQNLIRRTARSIARWAVVIIAPALGWQRHKIAPAEKPGNLHAA